jgi:entry exclusion lipoprotein TrbK
MPKHTTTSAWALAACAVAALVGCSKALPEVNDANCKFEAITAMDVPLATRQQFADQCARRGTFTNSPKKSY